MCREYQTRKKEFWIVWCSIETRLHSALILQCRVFAIAVALVVWSTAIVTMAKKNEMKENWQKIVYVYDNSRRIAQSSTISCNSQGAWTPDADCRGSTVHADVSIDAHRAYVNSASLIAHAQGCKNNDKLQMSLRLFTMDDEL